MFLRCRALRFARFWIPLVGILCFFPAPAAGQEVVYVRQDDGTIVKQLVELKEATTDNTKRIAQLQAELKVLRADVARLEKLEGVKSEPTEAHTTAPAAVRAARAPVGHTHTCSKGHTWDHSMDGGSHRCPDCGEYQNVQDPPGRSVVYTPAPSYPAPASFGSGCSAAGCSTGFSAPRRGVFGGVFRR